MSVLGALLAQAVPFPPATASVGAEEEPENEPKLVSTPRQMPNIPAYYGVPKASVGALADTAAGNRTGGNAIANLLIVAAVGGAAYWFGKSRAEKKADAAPPPSSKYDLVPGTSITVRGENLPSATVKVGAAEDSRARTRARKPAKEVLVSAPPSALRGGAMSSFDFDLDDSPDVYRR